ncbi:MAG: glycosyltransferase [Planctomycetota bacterium]|jgi:glycosyltransferase involved in cell wall biosynthesis
MMFKDTENISFLCFGGGDWWYHNRGHIDMQLMRRFARMGTTLYVNAIVMQKPNLKKNIGGGKSFTHKFIRKTKSILRGLRKSGAGFWVYSPISLPVHHINWLKHINDTVVQHQVLAVMRRLKMHNPVIWVASPAACNVAVKMKNRKLIYQRADRLEEYPNVDVEVIRRYDLELKAKADLTIFANEKLYEQENGQCKKAIYLDHGVDFDVFTTAENNIETPSDIRDIDKPIVGFFGGIDDHTSDIDLVKKVIDLLPEMSFVFIGSPSIDCGELLSKKNVIMLGQKPYEQIPHYGKCFNVAIMPWRQNRWIEACNPIKLKEYLALGKPVVSTPFAELQKYCDVVYQADTPEEFAKSIEKALAENSPERVVARKKKVEMSTWDSKAQLVLDELFGKSGY